VLAAAMRIVDAVPAGAMHLRDVITTLDLPLAPRRGLVRS